MMKNVFKFILKALFIFKILNITKEIFFFRNHAENEVERLVPDLFLFFKKEVNASGLQLGFNIP